MPTSLVSLPRRLAALMLALQLAACAHSSTPALDQRFGDAVRLAMAQQVRHPASAGNRQPADGLDGASAHLLDIGSGAGLPGIPRTMLIEASATSPLDTFRERRR